MQPEQRPAHEGTPEKYRINSRLIIDKIDIITLFSQSSVQLTRVRLKLVHACTVRVCVREPPGLLMFP